jgi:hypothetical protein
MAMRNIYRIPFMKPQEIEATWEKPWMEDAIKMLPREIKWIKYA